MNFRYHLELSAYVTISLFCSIVPFLFFASQDGSSSVLQQVIPEVLRKEVLKNLHEGTMGGHLGIEKTLARLRERFYWPGYHSDTQEWCRNCAHCASRKSPAPKARAPLTSIKTGYPLQLVAMDILGPFPESPAGNSYILVVTDYFTRWAEAYAIPNQEAITVAKRLTDEFFFRFSPPEQLHSDQGRNFESAVITEVCRLLGIVKTRTTPYHPQSDGLVERLNRTLLSMLATAALERPFEWEDHLRHLCMAYNSSVQATTGYTPFYLMFGRQARMPIDVVYGPAPLQPSTTCEYAARLRTSLETAYQRVREQMDLRLDRQKEIYDRRVHGNPFKKGELVWLYSPATPRGQCRKLHQPWSGPYKITHKLSDVTYRIQNVRAHRKRIVVHFDRLKRCPPNMRMPDKVRSESAQQNKQHSSQDPGTNLQLVEVDDPPPPPPPRYPRREHRPPDYFTPIVRHWTKIRDVFLSRGDLCSNSGWLCWLCLCVLFVSCV